MNNLHFWGSDAIGGVVYHNKSGLYKDKPFNIDFGFGLGSHRTRDASATISRLSRRAWFIMLSMEIANRTAGISVLSKNKFNYKALDGTSIPTGGTIERDGSIATMVRFRL